MRGLDKQSSPPVAEMTCRFPCTWCPLGNEEQPWYYGASSVVAVANELLIAMAESCLRPVCSGLPNGRTLPKDLSEEPSARGWRNIAHFTHGAIQ